MFLQYIYISLTKTLKNMDFNTASKYMSAKELIKNNNFAAIDVRNILENTNNFQNIMYAMYVINDISYFTNKKKSEIMNYILDKSFYLSKQKNKYDNPKISEQELIGVYQHILLFDCCDKSVRNKVYNIIACKDSDTFYADLYSIGNCGTFAMAAPFDLIGEFKDYLSKIPNGQNKISNFNKCVSKYFNNNEYYYTNLVQQQDKSYNNSNDKLYYIF